MRASDHHGLRATQVWQRDKTNPESTARGSLNRLCPCNLLREVVALHKPHYTPAWAYNCRNRISLKIQCMDCPLQAAPQYTPPHLVSQLQQDALLWVHHHSLAWRKPHGSSVTQQCAGDEGTEACWRVFSQLPLHIPPVGTGMATAGRPGRWLGCSRGRSWLPWQQNESCLQAEQLPA